MTPEVAELKEVTNDLITKETCMNVCDKMSTLVYDTIPHQLLICDNDGKIVFVNRMFLQSLDQKVGDVLGKNINEVCIYSVLDLEREHTHIKDVFIDSLGGWFELSCSTMYNDDTAPIGFLCTMVDVTDRHNNN